MALLVSFVDFYARSEHETLELLRSIQQNKKRYYFLLHPERDCLITKYRSLVKEN